MSRYRVTCLTPVLVGDGQRLAPIDYMIWRDQVNVLDQRRIFKLLARGPRLDSYLTQIRKAEKLDFTAWGGFAQNFAGRRIPLASPEYAAVWEKTRAEHLFIPTFAATASGQYLPATALKGALRTGMVLAKTSVPHLQTVYDRMTGERPPRYPAEGLENALLGTSGQSRTRPLTIADSDPLAPGSTKVYLVRTATLLARGANKPELGWKTAPHGSVEGRRASESTPIFAEMAVPGATFQGQWRERPEFHNAELLKALKWRETEVWRRAMEAANQAAELLLGWQMRYAETAGLAQVQSTLGVLRSQLEAARNSGNACLLCIGWGTGFAMKAAGDLDSEPYRQILRRTSLYGRAIQTGLPFPKTRRLIFSGQQASSLPGWVRMEFLQA